MIRICLFTLCIVLSSCSAHSPLIIKNTTESKQISATKFPSHTNPVFITEENLPPNIAYEILEQIEIGKVWYGDTKEIEQSLATRAQQIGADAVIEFKSWHQPSGWSWAAPHGSGKAIKSLDKESIDLSGISGSWRQGKTVQTNMLNQSKEQQTRSETIQPTSNDIVLQSIYQSIKNENFEETREFSIRVSEDGNQNPQTLDALAELVWEQRGETNDTLVDALSYLCNTIGKSKNPRYRLLMEVVKIDSESRKLRRYAQRSLRGIPVDVTVEQFVPGKGRSVSKEKL